MKFSKSTALFFSTAVFSFLIVISSCKKDNVTATIPFNAARQAVIDDSVLVQYLMDQNLTDSVAKTSTGLYYRFIKTIPDSIGPRPDSLYPNPDYKSVKNGDLVFVRYEGRLLNDTLFDGNINSAIAFQFRPGVSSVISGWNEGVRFFKKGEMGYLYMPSRLAYKNFAQGKIPPNSCIKFFIHISNVE